MILRLGWRLARSGRRDHGWRQAAMLVGTFLATTLVLAGCSLVLMAIRENDREQARSAVTSSAPMASDLLVVNTYDFWEGTPFPAIWIEPRDPSAATVVPPGMDRLPPPGSSVVSPALDQAADGDPVLAARYPNRRVLGSDGYRSGDELFAWVTPFRTGALPTDQVTAVAAFGGGAATTTFGLAEDTKVFPLAVGAMALLLAPALGLLAAGAVTSAPLRDRRLEVLHRLGLRRGTLRAVVMVESAVLAIPGVFLAAALWQVVAPRLTTVPVVGRHVQPGDLRLPISLAVLVAAGTVAAMMVVAAASARMRASSATPRPMVASGGKVPMVRLAPLLVGLAVVTYASFGTGRGAALTLLAGTALCVVSMLLVAPFAVKRAGDGLSRFASRVSTLVATRRLARDPSGSARPVIALAAFLVVTPAAMAFIAVVDTDDETSAERPTEDAVRVSANADDESWQRFELRAGRAGLVVPLDQRGRGTRLLVDCETLTAAVTTVTCNDAGRLTRDSRSRLASLLLSSPDVRLDDSGGSDFLPGARREAVVIGPATEGFAQQVRTAAASSLVAPLLNTREEPGDDPLVGWILGGLLTAAMMAAAALLLSTLDGFLSNRQPHRQLVAVGFPARIIRRLESTYFGIAFGVITGTGLAIGALIAWLFVRMQPQASYPAGAIGLLAAAVAVVGLAGAWLVGHAAERSSRTDDRATAAGTGAFSRRRA